MSVTQIGGYRQGTPAETLPQPHNIELEQALLGALLINNDVLHLCPTLEATHFVEELHRRVFTVAVAAIRQGRPANPLTLANEIGTGEVAPGITAPRYLTRLVAEAVTVANAAAYGLLIIELALRRRLVAVAEDARGLALDPPPGSTGDTVIDSIEEKLAELREAVPVRQVTRGSAGEMATRLLDRVRRIRAGEEKPSGIPIRLPEVDRDTGGLAPGQLWIVAGRAAMGKTILATRIVRSVGRAGAGALLLSLEVNEEQINARLLADIAYSPDRPIAFSAIMRGAVDDENLRRLENAQQRVDAMPVVIDCPSGATLAQIGSKVRSERLRMERTGVKLGAVVIDYLDFIQATDRYRGNRVYEVAEISRGLKQLAKDQGVCVVLLAQINRQVEQRPDKRPVMSDLRDSGNLEQDADVVAMIYREAYYLEKSSEFARGDDAAIVRMEEVKNRLELIIGKNRAGPTRRHILWCDVACSHVEARAREAM